MVVSVHPLSQRKSVLFHPPTLPIPDCYGPPTLPTNTTKSGYGYDLKWNVLQRNYTRHPHTRHFSTK